MKKLIFIIALLFTIPFVNAQQKKRIKDMTTPITRPFPIEIYNNTDINISNETTFGVTLTPSKHDGKVTFLINMSTDIVPLFELELDFTPTYIGTISTWSYRIDLIGVDNKDYFVAFDIKKAGSYLTYQRYGYTPNSGNFNGNWVELNSAPQKLIASLNSIDNELSFLQPWKTKYGNQLLDIYNIKGIKSITISLKGDISLRLQNPQIIVPLEFAAYINNNHKSSNGNSKQYNASGSGFVISTNGIIATNYHVIEDAENVDVFMNRNGVIKKYNAKVLISDKTNDISLLKIEDASFTILPAIPYAVKTYVQDVGTSVFALGYPMSNVLGEEIKVTDGIISSKTGYQGDIVTYQISAPIQPGNSGGPLFDKQGNLIGITNAGVPDAQNVGYAIKTSYLRNLIDVAPNAITLPSNNTISGLTFTEKIKRLTPYVVLIKVK